MSTTRLKCISLWQPWASAMALNLKHNETRGRAASHRGLLGIHAAQQRGPEVLEAWKRLTQEREIYMAFSRAGITKFGDLPFGQLLCTVQMFDCLPAEAVLKDNSNFTETEYWLGNYSAGRFAWMTHSVRRLKSPFPVSGRQGFFFVNVPSRLMPK